MDLLTEFLFRLTFGLTLGMTLVSSKQVTSGYFRNNLYVTLGLSALAALLAQTISGIAVTHGLIAAVLSYVGSVCWLYEKPKWGKAALIGVAWAALIGSWHTLPVGPYVPVAHSELLHSINVVTSGLTLGVVMAAMLLGHWYLNAPGMQLAPLRRLLAVAAIVVTLQAAICACGAWLELAQHSVSTQWWLFLALRWLFGLIGVIILIWMARRTLEVPNTQSATGILYVAVIGTFVGETMSLLLSAESIFPV